MDEKVLSIMDEKVLPIPDKFKKLSVADRRRYLKMLKSSAESRKRFALASEGQGHNFAFVAENNQYFDYHAGAACLGGIGGLLPKERRGEYPYPGYKNIETDGLVLDRSFAPSAYKVLFDDEMLRYATWWIKKSIFKDAFLTRNVKDILKNGIVIPACYPGPYIVAAIIGLRYLWEYPGKVQTWCVMTNNGMDPRLAAVMCHYYIYEYKPIPHLNYLTQFGHSWWYNNDTQVCLRNYLKGELNPRVEKPFYKSRSYAGLMALFSQTAQGHASSFQSGEPLVLPPVESIKIKSTFGTEIKTAGLSIARIKEFQDEVLKLNNAELG